MKNRKIKMIIMLSALFLIVTAAVEGTYALLSSFSKPQENVFTPANVACEVSSDGTQYSVKNIGNIDVYVRVAIIPNWQKNGNIYALEAITANDFSIHFDDWELLDGYFYYPLPLAPNEITSPISIELLTTPPVGCEFVPEFLTEAIQAEPIDAVRDAWGYPAD